MKFKSKIIEGLTYEPMGVLNFQEVYGFYYDGDLPANYREIVKQEIMEFQREQRRIEAKVRKDKWDFEKFGRTF